MSAYDYFVQQQQQQQQQSQGSQAPPVAQVPASFGPSEHDAERPPLPPPQALGLLNPLLPMGSLPPGHPLLQHHQRPGINGLSMGHPNMHPSMNQLLMQPPSGDNPLSQELLQSFLAQQQAAHGVALHQAAAAAAAAGVPLPTLQSLHHAQQQQHLQEQQPTVQGNLNLLPSGSASDAKGGIGQPAGAEVPPGKEKSTPLITGSDASQPEGPEINSSSSSSSGKVGADKVSLAALSKAEASNTAAATTSPPGSSAPMGPSPATAAAAAAAATLSAITAGVRGNSAAAIEERAARKRKIEADARQAGGLSKFEGVVWHRKKRKWRAQWKTPSSLSSSSSSSSGISGSSSGNGDGNSPESVTVLGWFETAEDAARAYDAHATTLGLPVNFPQPGQEQVVKRVTARYKGVNWNSGNQKWKAQIKVDGKVTHLGYFENEDVAARKYDEMAAAQGKPVNFPAPHSGQQQASKGGAEGGSRGGSSIYKGVCWDKVNSHWKATIKINGKAVNLGNFESEEEAARKFDKRANELGRGLNFPPGSAPLTPEDREASKARAIAAAAAAALQQQAKAQQHAAAQAALQLASQAAKRPHENLSSVGATSSNSAATCGVARDTATDSAVAGGAAAADAVGIGEEDEENDDGEESGKKQQRTLSVPKTSQFKGVCWHKPSQKWAAQIMVGRKRQHIGSYDTELEAARKYDEHALASGGRMLNFPTAAALEARDGGSSSQDSVAASALEVAPAPTPPMAPLPPLMEHRLLHRHPNDENCDALSLAVPEGTAAVPTAPGAHFAPPVNTAQPPPVENLNGRPDIRTSSLPSAAATTTATGATTAVSPKTEAGVGGQPQSGPDAYSNSSSAASGSLPATGTAEAHPSEHNESSHINPYSNKTPSAAPSNDPNSNVTPHDEPQLQPQVPPQHQHDREQTSGTANENTTSDKDVLGSI